MINIYHFQRHVELSNLARNLEMIVKFPLDLKNASLEYWHPQIKHFNIKRRLRKIYECRRLHSRLMSRGDEYI